jgi:hypothetical protein
LIFGYDSIEMTAFIYIFTHIKIHETRNLNGETLNLNTKIKDTLNKQNFFEKKNGG